MVDIGSLIDAVIGREGGYSNSPMDRGGPTMWGITQQVARAYGYAGEMMKLPRSTAVAIYQQRYWTIPRFDQVALVTPAVAAELFDIGVNMGTSLAGTLLQRALNALNRGGSDFPDVPTDGQLGPVSIQSLRSFLTKRPAPEGPAVLLWMVRALRTARYVTICENDRSQESFEYGWIARQVRAAGIV